LSLFGVGQFFPSSNFLPSPGTSPWRPSPWPLVGWLLACCTNICSPVGPRLTRLVLPIPSLNHQSNTIVSSSILFSTFFQRCQIVPSLPFHCVVSMPDSVIEASSSLSNWSFFFPWRILSAIVVYPRVPLSLSLEVLPSIFCFCRKRWSDL